MLKKLFKSYYKKKLFDRNLGKKIKCFKIGTKTLTFNRYIVYLIKIINVNTQNLL